MIVLMKTAYCWESFFTSVSLNPRRSPGPVEGMRGEGREDTISFINAYNVLCAMVLMVDGVSTRAAT